MPPTPSTTAPQGTVEDDWFVRATAVFRHLLREAGSDVAGQLLSVHPNPNPKCLTKPDGSRIDPIAGCVWRRTFSPSYTFPRLQQLRTSDVGLRDAQLSGRSSFYWDPLHRVEPNGRAATSECMPRCPRCSELLWDMERKQPLVAAKGLIKRWMFDTADKVLLIGQQYACKKCNASFRSWDKEIIMQLPPTTLRAYPALHMPSGKAITRAVYRLLEEAPGLRLSLEQVSELLNSMHTATYHQARSAWVEYVTEELGTCTAPTAGAFGAFEDKHGWGGVPFRGEHLRSLLVGKLGDERRSAQQAYISALTGEL